MTPTPVGMRCPECSRQRTKVTRGTSAFGRSAVARATYVLVALNVLAFIAQIASGSGGFDIADRGFVNFALFGPAVGDGEPYRLITGGFLHDGPLHLAFNMFALFVLGSFLEPVLGTPRFVLLYFTALVCGSLGVLILDPHTFTGGASGAIFGIFGAAFVIARERRIGTVAPQIALLLVVNLAFTFGTPGISIGGHLGGLAGGFLCSLAIVAGDRGWLGARRLPAELAIMGSIAVVALAASLVIA